MGSPQASGAAPRRGLLPEGTPAIGVGLVVLGVTAYGFFVVAARTLGPSRYGTLSVLWTLVFFASPGVFFPLEQEVGRAVGARRALGTSGGPVVRRALAAAAILSAVLVAVSVATSQVILDELFDDDMLLFVSLLLALPAYAVAHTVRGALSGSGRFAAYGWALGGEGVARLLAAGCLALLAVRTSGAFGLLIPLASAAAVAVVLWRERGLFDPGPEAPWAELSGALGWLLFGALLSQAFVNAPVPLVKALAGEGEADLAGQFQAGLIVSRVPLFLFQAVQAALLPKLAGLAASGRLVDFRTGLRRVLVLVTAAAAAGIVGAWAFGPFALRLAFGAGFDELGRRDITLLAVSSASFMVAMALAQALVALRHHAQVALGWLVALAVLGAGTATSSDLLVRVEIGLVSGSVTATLVMSVLVVAAMRRGLPDTAERLVDALSPEHEIIEP